MYIVGGIVDKNRHKGLSARVAAELGIETGRLPIEEEGIKLSSCTVLSTMHGALLQADRSQVNCAHHLLIP